MNNIYQLSEELQRLGDLFDREAEQNEGEVSAEIASAFEQLTEELESNAPGLGNLFRKLRNEHDQFKAQADRFDAVAKQKRQQADRLKSHVLLAMNSIGVKKLADFSVCKNGGTLPLVWDGEATEEYFVDVPTLDTKKVRQALDEGKDLAFASYGERGVHVRIKA